MKEVFPLYPEHKMRKIIRKNPKFTVDELCDKVNLKIAKFCGKMNKKDLKGCKK